jgi:hypothetical protein
MRDVRLEGISIRVINIRHPAAPVYLTRQVVTINFITTCTRLNCLNTFIVLRTISYKALETQKSPLSVVLQLHRPLYGQK